MAEDRIDSVIDRAAVSGEIKATSAEIEQLIALIQSTKGANVNVMNAKNMTEYNAAVKTLTAEQYKLVQSQSQLAKAVAATTKAQEQESRLTKNLTNEHKLLSLAVADAQKKYFNLAITQGRLHPLSVQALADANAYKAKLVQLNQDVKTFNDNVGNYGKSATSYMGNLAASGKKAFGVIRTAANILPGLGLSGAFLLLFEGVGHAAEELGNTFSRLSNKTKLLNAEKKALKKVSEEAIINSVEEKTKLNLLVFEYQNAGTSLKRKKEIQDELQKAYPNYFGNLKTEKEFATGLTDAYNKLSHALEVKARIQALANVITENETKALKLEIQLTDDLAKGGVARAASGVLGNQVIAAEKKGAAEKIKLLRDTNKRLYQEAIKSEQELSKIGGDPSGGKDTKKKKGRDLAEADRKAAFEREKQRLQSIIDINNKIAADDQNHLEERLKGLSEAFKAEQQLIVLQGKFEKAEKGKTDLEIKQIDEKTAIDLLSSNSKYLEGILKLQEGWNKRRLDEDKKFHELTDKMNAEELKKYLDGIAKREKALKSLGETTMKLLEKVRKANKEAKEQEEKDVQQFLEFSKQSLDIVSSFINISTTKELNAIQDEIDALERKKQKEIEVVNQSILNDQDKAAKIAIIEARSATQRESLERRQREARIKAAEFEKALSIAQIIINTAQAVMKTYSAGGYFATAFAIIVGAIGAAQAAAVAATPIPRYKHGTEDHKGGLAIVGDANKSEGITLPDGTILKSPSHSTLVDLPAGTKVHPDFNKMMLTATMTKPVEFAAKSYSDSSAKVVFELKEVKKAIYKIPQTSVEVMNPLRQRIRYGHSINDHLTRNLGK